MFDLDSLTLGDLERLEEKTGQPMMEWFQQIQGGKLSAKDLTLLAWVVKSRDDPSYTLEDARKVRIDELGGELPPADAVPGAASKKR